MSDPEFFKLLARFESDLRRTKDIDALRKTFREEHDVIYVKKYTVQAHMRRMKPRPKARRKTPYYAVEAHA